MTGRSVTLTDDELVLLDGRCRDEVQERVDAAKARLAAIDLYALPEALAGLIADVVTEARRNGELVFWNRRINACSLCGENPGYVKFKSGRRKGEPDYNRRLRLAGIELARPVISFDGSVHLGGCKDCVERALPFIRDALASVPAQVPDVLAAPGRAAWVKSKRRKCTACGWEGHEGQMGKSRTLMGDGSYPSTCPECGAENRPLGRLVVDIADGFDVVAPEDSNSSSSEPTR